MILLSVICGIGLLAGFLAQALPARGGPASGALPADRAAMYRSLLVNSLRTEPYAVAPREDVVMAQLRVELGPDASMDELRAAADEYYAEFHRRNNKVSRPNALAQVGRMKAREMAQSATARQGSEEEEVSALTGQPNVLTVMMNFTGQETYTTEDAVLFAGACLTDTTVYSPTFEVVIDGPRFNEIPDPAGVDNWLPWIPPDSPTGGYSQEYYEQFMFSTTGYTDILRPELENPWDGGQGFDFSGVTFKNYYLEQSRGVYDPQGAVIEVDSPHAESFYGAESCAGGFNAYNGDVSRVASHAGDLINSQYPGASTGENPDFNWADWDIEDVADFDNDGNFNEPDGYVDHFFLIEAGLGEHNGGGEILEFALWGHSSDVNPGLPGAGPEGNQIGGYQVLTDTNHPLGGIWILNYTVSDEGSGLGILVHEYGHDIGLPDNYGTDGTGPNPGLWDVMASGSWNGELAGMRPANMSIWDKEFLGWNNPREIDEASWSGSGEAHARRFTVGQQSIPPAGTQDGLRINLPNLTLVASVPPFDSNMWWSQRGDDRIESIVQTFTLQPGETATVSAQLAYFIELDWDYLYWEFSSPLTGDWVPLEVFSDTVELTTDTNPNGNNPSGNGITGESPNGSWVHATATIDPSLHDGGEVQFRFRYFTDAAVQEEGVYLDNISIDGDMQGNIFFDDAEGGDLWTHLSEGINTTAPWIIFNGTKSVEHYYLVEWRNAGEETGAYGTSNTAPAFERAGFDLGLNRTYWIAEVDAQGNVIRSPFFMHTPGMLVWYVNGTYEDNNVGDTLFDHPSWGAKGRVLLADANPYPHVVDDTGVGPRQIGERRSAFDGAYTLEDRPPYVLDSDLLFVGNTSTTVPGELARPVFRDRIGVAPGVTGPPEEAFFIDFDAGVVLPTEANVPYWAAWDFFGDTGNPGLEAFGINLAVVDQAADGTWGQIKFWLDDDTVFLDKMVSTAAGSVQLNEIESLEELSRLGPITPGQHLTYTVRIKDASGTRYADDFSYTYDAQLVDGVPRGTTLIPDSLTFTSGPWGEPGTVSVEGNRIIWTGQLGANPLHVPDAEIQYVVVVDDAGACLANRARLTVDRILIETDTFGNPIDPFRWPKERVYFTRANYCE
jgi:immune inhibitor A